MTLHLRRLAVGCEAAEDLIGFQRRRLAERRAEGLDGLFTYTRNSPKRLDELCDGGSLYWIIKGHYRVRQRILGAERTIADETGRSRCQIWLDPTVVWVEPRRHKPFQGWRYLRPEEAPADVPQPRLRDDDGERNDNGDDSAILAEQLRQLGLA